MWNFLNPMYNHHYISNILSNLVLELNNLESKWRYLDKFQILFIRYYTIYTPHYYNTCNSKHLVLFKLDNYFQINNIMLNNIYIFLGPNKFHNWQYNSIKTDIQHSPWLDSMNKDMINLYKLKIFSNIY